MNVIKPLAIALIASSPLVGAASHGSTQAKDQRTDLKALCASAGTVATKPAEPEALSIAVFAEASAIYGSKASESLFCHPKTVPTGSAVRSS